MAIYKYYRFGIQCTAIAKTLKADVKLIKELSRDAATKEILIEGYFEKGEYEVYRILHEENFVFVGDHWEKRDKGAKYDKNGDVVVEKVKVKDDGEPRVDHYAWKLINFWRDTDPTWSQERARTQPSELRLLADSEINRWVDGAGKYVMAEMNKESAVNTFAFFGIGGKMFFEDEENADEDTESEVEAEESEEE